MSTSTATPSTKTPAGMYRTRPAVSWVAGVTMYAALALTAPFGAATGEPRVSIAA